MGFEDGMIHLSINDSFEIGNFDLQKASQILRGGKPIRHCSNPRSTTHALIVASEFSEEERLYAVPLDLRLVSSAGRYLSLLASKSTQLRNILRYLHQVQGEMYTEYVSAQEIPNKFIQNIEQTLSENSDFTWVEAAYHLVVTGNCFSELREWLVEEIGERV